MRWNDDIKLNAKSCSSERFFPISCQTHFLLARFYHTHVDLTYIHAINIYRRSARWQLVNIQRLLKDEEKATILLFLPQHLGMVFFPTALTQLHSVSPKNIHVKQSHELSFPQWYIDIMNLSRVLDWLLGPSFTIEMTRCDRMFSPNSFFSRSSHL